MRGSRSLLLAVLCSMIFFAQCNQLQKNKQSENYRDSILQWRKERLKNLKSPSGWLNLSGLFWLDKGKNTVGSDSSNDVVFSGKAPPKLGTFYLGDNDIHFSVHDDVQVYHQDSLISEITLKTDAGGKPTVLKHGPLKWFVIKRSDQYGIRLRDLKSPLLEKLTEVPAFPVNENWRIRVTYAPFDEKKTIEVPNVLGATYQETTPGLLKFKYQGEQYTLYPLGSRKSLFLVFGDDTNAQQTYGGGRFLAVGEPNENNITHIDFNKAYNPPCAFTPYATCPLPPRQNVLPFKVTAGEKAPDIEVPHH